MRHVAKHGTSSSENPPALGPRAGNLNDLEDADVAHTKLGNVRARSCVGLDARGRGGRQGCTPVAVGRDVELLLPRGRLSASDGLLDSTGSANIFYLLLVLKIDFFGCPRPYAVLGRCPTTAPPCSGPTVRFCRLPFEAHRRRRRPKHVKLSKLITKASRPGFACEGRPISHEHPELVVPATVDVPAERWPPCPAPPLPPAPPRPTLPAAATVVPPEPPVPVTPPVPGATPAPPDAPPPAPPLLESAPPPPLAPLAPPELANAPPAPTRPADVVPPMPELPPPDVVEVGARREAPGEPCPG
jgi:hypothetical protein